MCNLVQSVSNIRGSIMVSYDIAISVIFRAKSEGDAIERLHKAMKAAGLEFVPDELKDNSYAIVDTSTLHDPKG